MKTQHNPNHSPAKARQYGRSTLSIAMALAGLALIGGAIIWGFFEDATDTLPGDTPTEVTVPPIDPVFEPVTVVIEEDTTPIAPEPLAEPLVETPAPEPDVPPVITLADSDIPLRNGIRALDAGPVAEQFAASEQLVARAVSVIDNLGAGAMPYKLIPIARPKTAFPIQDNGLRVTADPGGYTRFDGLSEWIDSLDAEAIVSLYRQFEPAANEAFAMLGNSDQDLDGQLKKALRLILTTPEPNADAELLRHEAVWIYADEALENLPDVQKQLLRLGPKNLEILQNKAREITYALEDTLSP